jgi:hypothetical protein
MHACMHACMHAREHVIYIHSFYLSVLPSLLVQISEQGCSCQARNCRFVVATILPVVTAAVCVYLSEHEKFQVSSLKWHVQILLISVLSVEWFNFGDSLLLQK